MRHLFCIISNRNNLQHCLNYLRKALMFTKKLCRYFVVITLMGAGISLFASEEKKEFEEKKHTSEKTSQLPPEIVKAIQDNKLEVVKKYLDDGGNPNAYEIFEWIDLSGQHHQVESPALLKAINELSEKGYEIAKLLLDRGAKVEEGMLSMAAHDEPKIVELLLAHGANPNEADKPDEENEEDEEEGFTPLHHWAHGAGAKTPEIADMLIKAGAKIDAAGKSGVTPLAEALSDNQEATAEYLIKHGADVNKALLATAKDGNALGIAFLLEKGAKVTTQDKDGKTIFDYLNGTKDGEEKETKENYSVKSIANNWIKTHKVNELPSEKLKILLTTLYYLISKNDAYLLALENVKKYAENKDPELSKASAFFYDKVGESIQDIIDNATIDTEIRNEIAKIISALHEPAEKMLGRAEVAFNRQLCAAAYEIVYHYLNKPADRTIQYNTPKTEKSYPIGKELPAPSFVKFNNLIEKTKP